MLKELVGGINIQFSSPPTKPMPLKSIDCSPHTPPAPPGAVQGTGWPLFKAVSVDQSWAGCRGLGHTVPPPSASGSSPALVPPRPAANQVVSGSPLSTAQAQLLLWLRGPCHHTESQGPKWHTLIFGYLSHWPDWSCFLSTTSHHECQAPCQTFGIHYLISILQRMKLYLMYHSSHLTHSLIKHGYAPSRDEENKAQVTCPRSHN